MPGTKPVKQRLSETVTRKFGSVHPKTSGAHAAGSTGEQGIFSRPAADVPERAP